MIASLVADLITIVIVGPLSLASADLETGALRIGGEGHIVKDIKLILGADDHLVCDALFLHIRNGTLCHVAGILVEGAVGGAINDHNIADHGQGRNLREGIDGSRIQIRHKDHVTALNGSIAIVGTVKANTILHGVLVQAANGNAQVTPSAIDVSHLKVNDFDFLFFA